MTPSKAQKKILKEWISDARYIYNLSVEELKKDLNKTKYELRNSLVIKKNNPTNNQRILDSMDRTPKDIRAKACFEACAAKDLSLKKTKKINPRYKYLEKAIKKEKDIILKKEFQNELEYLPKYMAREINLNFRRRKSQWQHIFIPKTAIKIKEKQIDIYPKYKLGKIDIKENINNIDHDIIIRNHSKLDIWYIIIPEKIKAEKEKYSNMISIDPGMRTFLTGIDSDGNILEIGKDKNKINNLIDSLDYHSNKYNLKNLRGRKRYNFLRTKRNLYLIRFKLVNLVNDFHKKTSKYLLDNYDIIILPKLRSKDLLKKGNGMKHEKKFNRSLNLFSHCKFHDYLSWKAKALGKSVINQNEAYTSKTCYSCGKINDIGSNKIYNCNFCHNKCDRDIQSSLNILTKYLSSYSSTI